MSSKDMAPAFVHPVDAFLLRNSPAGDTPQDQRRRGQNMPSDSKRQKNRRKRRHGKGR